MGLFKYCNLFGKKKILNKLPYLYNYAYIFFFYNFLKIAEILQGDMDESLVHTKLNFLKESKLLYSNIIII